MLQVQRKKHGGGHRKLWFSLLIIAAAAAAALGFFSLRKGQEVPHRTETGGTLANYATEDIREIQIQLRGRGSWEVKRDADGIMRMEGASGWEPDATLEERIEDALAHLVYEDILTESPEVYSDRLSDFGLEDPELTARVLFSDGKEIVIRIGNDSGIEDADFRYMILEGDPCLYAVAGSLMKDLNVEKELLHPVSQPEIQADRIDQITVSDGNGNTLSEWRLEGKITERDAAANWMIVYPVIYPADQDRISNLKKNIENLRMGLYIAEMEDVKPEEYGLDVPAYVLEIHMAEGTTGRVTESGAYGTVDRQEETIRIEIGGTRNEMTDYCLYDGTLFTVNHFTVSSITETEPMDTAARYPVTVLPESLRSVEILRENMPSVRYELTYRSVPSEDEDTRGEQIAECKKNGEDFPAEAFLAAYERWRVVNVSGTLPEGWTKKETKTAYIISSLQGAVHTIELSEFDAMHDAVTVDGQTLFYLIKGGLGEMP